MRTTLKMPKAGETAEVFVVLKWLAEPGERVEAGDPILEVETDKVNVDVPSPMAGTMVQHMVEPDDEIEIGTPICVLET